MQDAEEPIAEEGRSDKRGRIAELGPVWISAIGTLIAALVAVVGLVIANSGGGSDPGSTSASADTRRHPLAPATTPPRIGLCTEQLKYYVDGTAGPLTCADGRLNKLTWEYYARLTPSVMSLGPNANPVLVEESMCNDFMGLGTDTSEELDAYRAAELYYSWDFAVDPTGRFPEKCS